MARWPLYAAIQQDWSLTTSPFRSVLNHEVPPSLHKDHMLHFQRTTIFSRMWPEHIKKVLDGPE